MIFGRRVRTFGRVFLIRGCVVEVGGEAGALFFSVDKPGGRKARVVLREKDLKRDIAFYNHLVDHPEILRANI